jgi:bacillithiol biosynthesis cysteine-adding enzyme BshC
MQAECYPISALPGTTKLFRDFAEGPAESARLLRRWYPHEPFSMEWAKHAPELNAEHRALLADALYAQVTAFGGGEAALANVEKLRSGASAVVTGQQVALFGGPLLTLLKAATAIRKAQDATKASGREYVPVFWLATEDHDLAEVDQVALVTKQSLETLKLDLRADQPQPVGGVRVDDGSGALTVALEQASELLEWAPVADWLREFYAEPDATLASAFGKLLTRLFAKHGLVVMDASSRVFHALGAPVLRAAIERADELEAALIVRSKELEAAGYHAQVKVDAGMSLLFLISANEAGEPVRLSLRRGANGEWRAGKHEFTTAELLEILENEPEQLSPNALLRAVFQDAILPTAAYIGGPAEVAYFAQSAVVYEKILGRVTPVLPRLSATLLEPAIAQTMAAHEVTLLQVFEAKTAEELAVRLGARAMPIEGKRKIAAVGNAMDAELTALTEYMGAMSADLGRSAGVSANKMRYQMNRLRRMAAAFEVQKEASLKKHATAIMLNVFPEGHLQERLLAGVGFVARHGDELAALLVEHAGQECPGHRVIAL